MDADIHEDTVDRTEYSTGPTATKYLPWEYPHVERAGYYLTCLSETLGWYVKGVYTGHTMKKADDGWLLIVRMKRGGQKWVTFIGGDSPVDCIRMLAWDIRCKRVKWRLDLY